MMANSSTKLNRRGLISSSLMVDFFNINFKYCLREFQIQISNSNCKYVFNISNTLTPLETALG